MMKKFLTGIASLTVCVAVALGTPSTAAAAGGAWAPGEKLQYSVKFGFFTAGTSVFSVDQATLNGKNVYKFQSTILSAPGFFYKIDDRGVSWSDPASLRSFRYDKIQKEGDEKSSNITTFDQGASNAVRTEDGKAHPAMNYNKLARDVLGAIYHVRNQEIAVGRTIRFPVHDGKRDYTMEVVISRRENIRVPAGDFNCLVVEPKLRNLDGTLKKKGHMTLWMTDDARHLPVRIKIVLPFGHLVASLTKMSGTV